MGPQNFGYIRHVEPFQPWRDNQVHHGDHAVQLSFVNRDGGVHGVLTLFFGNCLMNSRNYSIDNLLIQVPRNILNNQNLI